MFALTYFPIALQKPHKAPARLSLDNCVQYSSCIRTDSDSAGVRVNRSIPITFQTAKDRKEWKNIYAVEVSYPVNAGG